MVFCYRGHIGRIQAIDLQQPVTFCQGGTGDIHHQRIAYVIGQVVFRAEVQQDAPDLSSAVILNAHRVGAAGHIFTCRIRNYDAQDLVGAQ